MTSDAARVCEAVRAGAGLFEHPDRLLFEVTGGDRVRWLQGQISNDVEGLSPGEGCYATALTVKGRIVADLHVLAREDRFWLETGASAREALWQRLDRYIVADDVTLHDESGTRAWLGLEGPAAERVLSASGVASLPADGDAVDARIGESSVTVWRFGFTNLPAFQLLVPVETAGAVRASLEAAGESCGLVAADAAALEILRVESGVALLGPELDEDVFPAEARLHHAISTSKGCYTGQEIVERIRSRGAVNHLLVGLVFDTGLPTPGSELHDDRGKRVGEVTSVADSPRAGAIALGYLRRELAEPGIELKSETGVARVAALPFVPA